MHETNRGLAAARNTAFQQATGRYVGAVDADVIADKDLLKYLMMEMENSPATVAGLNARLFEQYTENPADKWRIAHLNQDIGPQRIAPLDLMSGAKTLFRREAVLEVGGYDERYRTNYEDVSMCKQLRAAGYELVATPYAFAGHLRRDTPQSVLKASWNYVFWACHEAGYYASRAKVVELMTRTLRAEYEIIRWDTERGDVHLLYLDYLHIFVASFCDMTFAGRSGLFTLGEVHVFQEAMLDTVRLSNLCHGELLQSKVRRDLECFLTDPGTAPLVMPPETEPYLTLLRNFLDAAGDELCSLLLRL
jgi:cellulose synthase/poly-beta-1,6-N-acetylglucosamine synthase-like glycosyltransferase